MAQARKVYKETGQYLRELRVAAGLTQKELNDQLGYPYYTIISNFESGKTKFPASAIETAAKALKVDLFEFTRRVMAENEPELFEILFHKLSCKPE